ncbi:hypothetical protein AAE250_22745 [Bacteroides sp. GD17]|jgi:hypothetical protein|uniref:hypothetical protein n=1 Tax=Bacteroides sp. GD17 TaxID=3139826 RepID=UPI0025DFA9A4|nr:hypothetical protein [uncultured Bacteroides sp.]
MDWILGIIATSLGGLNIFQIIYFRTQRDKLRAEADDATIGAKKKDIDLQQDQYDYLLSKLSKYQEDYFALLDKVQSEARNHSEVINTKCNEISELKSKIVYYKGLRCYKSDCSGRIGQNPKDKEEKK